MNWNWFTSPRICSWQEGDPGRTNILVGVQRQGKTNVPAQRQSSTSFPLLEGESAFLSSTDWMRPTHISEGNLLYLVYLVNLIENNLTEAPRIMFDQISGYLVAQWGWHIKLTITGFNLPICRTKVIIVLIRLLRRTLSDLMSEWKEKFTKIECPYRISKNAIIVVVFIESTYS